MENFLTIAAINECAEGSSNCEQFCSDTGTGFVCSCRTGYTLNSDQASCSGEALSVQAVQVLSAVCVMLCHTIELVE